MEAVYKIIETLIPLDFMQYNFMKNAFLTIVIITPLFGLIGTMIVNKKMAFFSDALGHSALTGIAIGIILGITNIDLAMGLFAIIFALLLNRIKSSNLVSSDTIISVFSSLGIALGLALLSKDGNFSKYSSLLLGDILSIRPNEILYLLGLFILTNVFWLFFFNKLHIISISPSLAKTKNINIKLVENLFAIIIALIVMLSIRWIGILIINALLILPAASSRNISVNVREYHLFSVLFSLFSGIMGLIISYSFNIATGPTIVIIASIIFFVTYIFSFYVAKR